MRQKLLALSLNIGNRFGDREVPIREVVEACQAADQRDSWGAFQAARMRGAALAGEARGLELRLEHVPGEHFECPVCKDLCGIHDTMERRWRHMNFFQYRCELVARVPRTWFRKDGVHQVQVP
jgi:zinc-finger of transposase IS204/IS1001/IS1096/IS1165